MSGSVSTNASSKISQFGLYRTIDSRTEEFLKLSKKRQIRQGCACAAVSTAITVTIVVGFLLIYEYSIVPHNRKISAKETWQTITSESDEESSFEKKLNSKAEVNTIPKTSLIQAGLLQALSRNKFNKKPQLVGVKPTNYQLETTLASVYKINKFSDFKNRYTKSKEHNTTPNFSISPPKLSFQSKVKPSASYDNAFIKQYISKMIEKYIKSYKAQVVGRGDTLSKTTSTTTETITLNVISLNRSKHKVLDAKKSPDSCMCQWNLSQILKKIMKCVMNLGAQSKQKLCQNCKSPTKTTTVKTKYANKIGLNTRKTNKDKTMSRYTSQKPNLAASEDKKKFDLVNSPYINTLKEVLKLKAPYGNKINNLDFTSTEKSIKVFNATDGFSSKQILMNSLRDKHCTFFKDYISRLRKNKTFQSQIYDQEMSQPGYIKINDSFYSDIFNVAVPLNDLEQNPFYKPTVAPSSRFVPEKILDLNGAQYIKSQEMQRQKQKVMNEKTQLAQNFMQPNTQIPSISTTANFEANFFEDKTETPYMPRSKIENMKSIFEQDTETVQKQTSTLKNQEQQYNLMQDDKYFIEEDDDIDEDDDILSISRTKDTNNTDSIDNQPPFKNEVNNEITFVQGAEYNANNQQQIQDDPTTEKQFKWYKKHQVKYNEVENANHENDFFDQLTKRFNAAEYMVADKRKKYRSDQNFKENQRNLHKKQSVYSAASIGRPSYLEIIRNYRNQDYDHDNRFSDNDYIN